MSDFQYVRRSTWTSWHVVRTHTRAFDGWLTLCGRGVRMPDTQALDEIPGNEKTCERCAVIALKRVDPAPEDDPSVAHEPVVA